MVRIREKEEAALASVLETLTAIAEWQSGVTDQEDQAVVALWPEPMRRAYALMHWLHEGKFDLVLSIVKELLGLVIKQIQAFCARGAAHEMRESLTRIVLLVGDAVQKLDEHCLRHAPRAVAPFRALKEYEELRLLFTKEIGELPAAASAAPAAQPVEASAVLFDLNRLKKDKEYELLYLRHEDGTPFFAPDLFRHVKLACEVSEDLPGNDDPLVQVKSWHDRQLQASAKNILKAVKMVSETHFKNHLRFAGHNLVKQLNCALMALMLAANPRNLMRNYPAKTCYQYFQDFLHYLRAATLSPEYLKLSAAPPAEAFLKNSVELTQALCEALYTHTTAKLQSMGVFDLLLGKPDQKAKSVVEILQTDYVTLRALFQQHPNGPLFKAFDLLHQLIDEEQTPAFDPLQQDNPPHKLYGVGINGELLNVLHLPSPTYQQTLERALVLGEFSLFLQHYATYPTPKRHLLINLQDRTSWREHARANALEELQRLVEYGPAVTVVTLGKETDFYHQLAPYYTQDEAQLFIEQFKEHLSGAQTGYFFPSSLQGELFPSFTEALLSGIHTCFFGGAKKLSRDERLSFIELGLLFLQLRLIDLCKPESLSFSCKDGCDSGAAAAAQFFFFLKTLSGESFALVEIEELREMLFAPALLAREREILPERFQRMLHCMRTLEQWAHGKTKERIHKTIQSTFGPLFDQPTLLSASVYPVTKEGHVPTDS